jgi:hypothetical protein
MLFSLYKTPFWRRKPATVSSDLGRRYEISHQVVYRLLCLQLLICVHLPPSGAGGKTVTCVRNVNSGNFTFIRSSPAYLSFAAEVGLHGMSYFFLCSVGITTGYGLNDHNESLQGQVIMFFSPRRDRHRHNLGGGQWGSNCSPKIIST